MQTISCKVLLFLSEHQYVTKWDKHWATLAQSNIIYCMCSLVSGNHGMYMLKMATFYSSDSAESLD